MSLNNCVFIGRLTRDVELKTVGNGTNLANFTIAVDKRYKSKNDNQPTADFIPVSAWRKTADFVSQYFGKGKQVYVRGALETYSYEGSDGNKRYGFRINAEEVGFADSIKSEDRKNETQNSVKQQNTSGNFIESGFPSANDFDFGDPSNFNVSDDDLPF